MFSKICSAVNDLKKKIHLKLHLNKKSHNKRIPVMGSESPANDLNPDLREIEKSLVRCTCVSADWCVKVCLSQKSTSSFPGSDFSQDKDAQLLPSR